MSDDRLPAHLEVAALLRRAASTGGFATVLRKGDADRGSVMIAVTRRGTHHALLERVLSPNGAYCWQAVGPDDSPGSNDVGEFLARRARFDPDSWVIELDIADPERFIAETTSTG